MPNQASIHYDLEKMVPAKLASEAIIRKMDWSGNHFVTVYLTYS